MFELYMNFMGRWGMLIFLCLGAMMAIGFVIAQILYNRRQRREYSRRLFGREVKEAELRKIERMGL